MAQLVLEHLLTISGFLLAVVLAVRVLQERRQPGGTLAWLMAIILIPYVGVPLYLLIGGRKVRRAARKKAVLYTGDPPTPPEDAGETGVWGPGVPPPRPGNTVQMHFNGETAFWRLMGMIEEAEKTL
ncbi:MAG TPA: PLDc N-terminal domain-containing protein, partial [Candidatus Hydrogenedentes bacterium]|nr:PLDc N-terminal domain-containing protein [Candidatus Hydrogenedentota bacterium]